MRGEVGLEADIDGENVPNEILSEGPPLITLSGKNDAPEHSRCFYSDRDSFPREEMDFFAMFHESEGRFRDTAVDLKEDGTYEIVASPFDEEYPDGLPIDPYIQDYNGI